MAAGEGPLPALRRVGLGLLPPILAGVVYRPILGEYFKFDDFLHLYQIANLGVPEFLITPHGGHLLVAGNLVFAAAYRLFGMYAPGFQAIALATHLLNVWLLYQALRHLTGRPLLACAAASLFGMLPTAYGSVHWFSVYGHVLAGTAVTFLLYDVARRGERSVGPGTALRWALVLLLCASSFGVGLGVAAAAGPLLFLLRPTAADRRRVALWLAPLLVLVPLLYEAQFRLATAVSGAMPPKADLLGALRELPLGLLSTLDLLCVGLTSLLLGPVLVFHGPAFGGAAAIEVGPLAGLDADGLLRIARIAAALAAATLLWWGWRADARSRSLALAGLLGATAAYAVIALGRIEYVRSLGGSAAVLAGVSRYHYVAPIFLVTLATVAAADRLPTPGPRPALAGLAAFAGLATPLFAMAVRSFDASPAHHIRRDHMGVLLWIEESVLGQPEGSLVTLRNRRLAPLETVTPEQFPGAAALFLIHHRGPELHGRRVRFEESSPAVLLAARSRPDAPINQLLTPRRGAAPPGFRGPSDNLRRDR